MRRSTASPIVVARTRSDEAAAAGEPRSCSWGPQLQLDTSAATGRNVAAVFELCLAAALEPDTGARSDNKKDRLVRPNTLKLSSMVSNLDRNKNKTLTNNTKYSEPLYENPEEMSPPRAKLKTQGSTASVIPYRQCRAPPPAPPPAPPSAPPPGRDEAVFSPQSASSCLKSPSPSDLDSVPMR